MTLLLSCMTASDQPVDWPALTTAAFKLIQTSLKQQSTNVYIAVRCTAVLEPVCLPACNSQPCMHALHQLLQPKYYFWVRQYSGLHIYSLF